jgi:hypothetical protein
VVNGEADRDTQSARVADEIAKHFAELPGDREALDILKWSRDLANTQVSGVIVRWLRDSVRSSQARGTIRWLEGFADESAATTAVESMLNRPPEQVEATLRAIHDLSEGEARTTARLLQDVPDGSVLDVVRALRRVPNLRFIQRLYRLLPNQMAVDFVESFRSASDLRLDEISKLIRQPRPARRFLLRITKGASTKHRARKPKRLPDCFWETKPTRPSIEIAANACYVHLMAQQGFYTVVQRIIADVTNNTVLVADSTAACRVYSLGNEPSLNRKIARLPVVETIYQAVAPAILGFARALARLARVTAVPPGSGEKSILAVSDKVVFDCWHSLKDLRSVAATQGVGVAECIVSDLLELTGRCARDIDFDSIRCAYSSPDNPGLFNKMLGTSINYFAVCELIEATDELMRFAAGPHDELDQLSANPALLPINSGLRYVAASKILNLLPATATVTPTQGSQRSLTAARSGVLATRLALARATPAP